MDTCEDDFNLESLCGMTKWLSRILLKVWGFKWTGFDPETIPKKVYAVYPHTSNWDFPLGILIKFAVPLNVNYVGKNSLFQWPYGFIFRKLGGIPVERSKRTNFVDMLVNLYREYDVISFAIAPEGTRKKVRKFKSGFYYIAHNANVPIIFVRFDFKNRIVDFSEPFTASGDYKKDMAHIIQYFRGTQGIHPELACQWEDEEVI